MRMPWPRSQAREQEGKALQVLPLLPKLAAAEPRMGGDPPRLTCSHFKSGLRDFPGGPVGKTLCSQCRRPGFDPWSGN